MSTNSLHYIDKMKKRNGKAVSTQLTEKEFISILKLCEISGVTVSQITRGMIRSSLSSAKRYGYGTRYAFNLALQGRESFK